MVLLLLGLNFNFISISNRIDYDATVKAANDAQTSAQIAQNNAAEAAVKASLSSVHDIASGHGSSSHGSSGGSYHEISSGHGPSSGGSSYHGSEHGGHLDAYGSQKTLTVASANGAQTTSQNNNGGASSENKSSDSIARSTNVSKSKSSASSEVIASNHNYGSNSSKDFKPSPSYSYAGY